MLPQALAKYIIYPTSYTRPGLYRSGGCRYVRYEHSDSRLAEGGLPYRNEAEGAVLFNACVLESCSWTTSKGYGVAFDRFL